MTLLQAKQAVLTVCILKRLRRASHACRHIRTQPRRPARTGNLQARDPLFAQPAVNTACILTRPRLFARSAGCPHRLLLSALSSARDSSRAKQAVHTACILKVLRLFARSAGCQHRLRPQVDSSIFFDINDLVSLEGRFTPSVIEARKRTTSIAASKST